jgi:RNA polymerase sigma-70 factor (ECF subfamily)
MRRIHATCRRLCHDRGDAEDAAQNAMIAIVRGIDGFDGRSSVSSWIYRITTNACIDELRRRRRRPEPRDTEEHPDTVEREPPRGTATDPAEAAVASEQRRALAAALRELPEDYRVAVVLRDVADLDYSTIAEITGVPVGTVRSRIARGRGRLADRLSPETGRAADSRSGTKQRAGASKEGEQT